MDQFQWGTPGSRNLPRNTLEGGCAFSFRLPFVAQKNCARHGANVIFLRMPFKWITAHGAIPVVLISAILLPIIGWLKNLPTLLTDFTFHKLLSRRAFATFPVSIKQCFTMSSAITNNGSFFSAKITRFPDKLYLPVNRTLLFRNIPAIYAGSAGIPLKRSQTMNRANLFRNRSTIKTLYAVILMKNGLTVNFTDFIEVGFPH